MLIREFNAEDDLDLLRRCIAELQNVERALDPRLPHAEAMLDAYIAALLARCDEWTGAIYVAYDDGGSGLGVASVFAHVPVADPDEPPGTYALLSDLVVLPDGRGKGIGRALLAIAEAFAREQGARVMRLEVMAGNSAARSMYAGHGYRGRVVQLEKSLTAEHLNAKTVMTNETVSGILEFLRNAERLKNVTRTSWTSEGHRESVAEHTWRLCLMALVLSPEFPDLNIARLMRMCVIHDLGEAIGGDISATLQPPEGKSAQERADLLQLLQPLPESLRAEIVELWDEYETAASPEARVAKALDKLETIMQHNQGQNPPTFDYTFNLGYGTRYTADHPLIAEIRRILDAETRSRAETNEQPALDIRRPESDF